MIMKKSSLLHRSLHILRGLPRLWLASFVAYLGAGLVARAALIIDLPDLTLQPNQPNQTFTFSVQNDGGSVFLTGVQLDLIVGNGDVVIGGSGGAPAFQSVSLLAPGSLFSGNNNGDLGAGNFGSLQQLFQRSTSTSSGSVTLNAGTFNLATVTFDTTGIGPGDYSWSAATSPNGISFFTDTSPGGVLGATLFDGTLSVVPEPVNVALTIFGSLVALNGGLRWWSRRKAMAS